jgi:hypothetical protein
MQACAFCGEPFHCKRRTQRFCSARCNARNRAQEGTLAPNPRMLPQFSVIASLYESGLSCPDIAGRYGVNPSSVQSALERGGVTLRPPWVDAAKKNTGRRGPMNKNFTGERKIYHGYAWLYFPNHPARNKAGYILEHRAIVEESLQRLLEEHEHVHHINGDRLDNRRENLQVLSSSEHARLHNAPAEYRAANPEAAIEAARRAGRKGAAARWGE